MDAEHRRLAEATLTSGAAFIADLGALTRFEDEMVPFLMSANVGFQSEER